MTSANKIQCRECSAEMNHHADKVDYDAGDDSIFGGVVQEVHTCPHCGHIELRTAK